MNIQDFYKYIEQPELLNASTVAELQELLKAYPYFQTAHVLYLKSLYNQNNFKFNYQLKFSSVHVNNRKKLLFFIKGKTPSTNGNIGLVNNDGIKPIVLLDKEPIIEKQKAESYNTELVEESQDICEKSVEEFKPELIAEIGSLENKTDKVIFESHKSDKDTSEIIKNDKAFETVEELDLERIETIEEGIEKRQAELLSATQESEKSNKKLEDNIESKVLEKDKIEVVEEHSENLSPREILQRRIDEIKKSKKDYAGKEYLKLEPKVEKGIDLEIEIKPVLEAIEEPKTDLTLSESKESKEIDVLGDELADLVQVAAPAEYFLEGLQNADESIEDISKSFRKKKKATTENKQSFAYWVKHLQNKKDKQSNEKTKGKAKKDLKKSTKKTKIKIKEKSSLIDSFLADTKPKTIKPKPQVVNALKNSETGEVEKDEAFMTETLAQIYIKQAYYDKAIEAYLKLSLKYPKKNTYFATQIKKVKKLQLNS